MYSADPDYAVGGEVITDTAAHTGRFKCVDFYEDTQIAAMSSSIGSAFGGALAVTGTSGPGLDLKSEAIGYAVMTELPGPV